MKLIDIDALHITVSGGRHNGKREFADAVEKAIKAVPEVEAIPISWLQAKADSWNAELKTACPEDAESIRHIQQKYLGIIEEWRKEHETY